MSRDRLIRGTWPATGAAYGSDRRLLRGPTAPRRTARWCCRRSLERPLLRRAGRRARTAPRPLRASEVHDGGGIGCRLGSDHEVPAWLPVDVDGRAGPVRPDLLARVPQCTGRAGRRCRARLFGCLGEAGVRCGSCRRRARGDERGRGHGCGAAPQPWPTSQRLRDCYQPESFLTRYWLGLVRHVADVSASQTSIHA